MSGAVCRERKVADGRADCQRHVAISSFVTMINPATGDARTGLVPAVALFRSLADPARLAIIQHLTAGEARVVDLTGVLGLAQSTVSSHLACLRASRLLPLPPPGPPSVHSPPP